MVSERRAFITCEKVAKIPKCFLKSESLGHYIYVKCFNYSPTQKIKGAYIYMLYKKRADIESPARFDSA